MSLSNPCTETASLAAVPACTVTLPRPSPPEREKFPERIVTDSVGNETPMRILSSIPKLPSGIIQRFRVDALVAL